MRTINNYILLIIMLIICMTDSISAQIPTVRLDGDFGDEYSEGHMSVTDTNGVTTEYKMKSKWRGSSSKAFDKKSFAVKLLDDNGKSLDASILGMREDNNWILDAMAVDKARMRNRVSFDLWNDMAAPSFVKTKYEPESFNGTHGLFVEMYLNGNYHGIYCMTEKIDRKQLKLKKYKDGVKGILYKADSWDGTAFWNYSDYNNTQPTWMGWESQYPDVEDDGETDYQPLYEAVRFVADAGKEEFDEEVDARFDLPVWNDYFLLLKIILATDNHGKNTFTYIYDKTKDHMLGMAPWDMDATWGRNYDSGKITPDAVQGEHNLLVRLKNKEGYMQAMADRYFSLRKNILSPEALKARFALYFDYFDRTGAAQRETARWSGTNGITLDFEQEKAYIADWIDSRIKLLDTEFGRHTTSIRQPQTDNDCKADVTYNLNGQRMRGNLTKGIYIKNGKKTVIR